MKPDNEDDGNRRETVSSTMNPKLIVDIVMPNCAALITSSKLFNDFLTRNADLFPFKINSSILEGRIDSNANSVKT